MDSKLLLPPILPPAMLGILGGGQLGRMFVIAAKTMGYQVTVLDPDPFSPGRYFADVHLCESYTDEKALESLAQTCAAVTTEFENVPADALRWLAAQGIPVSPSGECIAITQDRILEKKWVRESGFATVPFLAVHTAADLEGDLTAYLPGILKTARAGYDGKGQVHVNTAEAAQIAFSNFHDGACVLEQKVDVVSEVSVILTRTANSEIAHFPVVENQHANGILDISIVPARIDLDLAHRAQSIAYQLAVMLDYVGVLTIEFFVLKNGSLLVNEIAPRPHNSGHYTLDATWTSQFEQQVRAMCNLHPGKTNLMSPIVMVNLLGQLWDQLGNHPDWSELMMARDVKLHLYGKKDARPDRKMGHYSVLGSTVEQALEQALAIKKTL